MSTISPTVVAQCAFSRLEAGFVRRPVIRRLAYITGLKLFDERAYESYDYRRRGRGGREEILHYDSLGPGGAADDFEQLWNRINLHARKPTAVVARTLIGSLVWELGLEGNRRAVAQFVTRIRERFGVAIVYAIHDARLVRRPSGPGSAVAKGDLTNQNIHAHFALSYCEVFGDGSLGYKVDALDPIASRRRGLPIPVDFLRPLWEECLNAELERAELPQRVDMRSLREQGVTDEVTTPLGPVNAALERAEIRTTRGEHNRAVRAKNRRDREELAALDRIRSLLKKVRDAREAEPAYAEVATADLLQFVAAQRVDDRIDLLSKKYGVIFMKDGGEGIVIDSNLLIVKEGAEGALRALLEDTLRRMKEPQHVAAERLRTTVDRPIQEVMRYLPQAEDVRRRDLTIRTEQLRSDDEFWNGDTERDEEETDDPTFFNPL